MSTSLHTAYIGLGSNLGDRAETLVRALQLLDEGDEVVVFAISAAYETAPMYVLDQPAFLNACAELRTTLAPHQLLQKLFEVEQLLGRKRDIDRGPRTLDLDLLFYEDRIIETPSLSLPHPDLHERAFVLMPLMDLSAELIHPALASTIDELLQALDDLHTQEISRHEEATQRLREALGPDLTR